MNFPIVSLFSGIGGLDLGLEAAGLGTVTYHVEADPFCRSILHHHWPEASTHDDVRTFDPIAAGVPAYPIVCIAEGPKAVQHDPQGQATHLPPLLRGHPPKSRFPRQLHAEAAPLQPGHRRVARGVVQGDAPVRGLLEPRR